MAQVGLGRVYLNLRRYPNAVETLNQVINEADKDIAAEAQYLLGDAYKGQSDCREAIVAYMKNKYLYPGEIQWVVPSIYEAAQCNETLGRLADARRLYQSLLQDYPSETEYVQKAKERIQALAGK